MKIAIYLGTGLEEWAPEDFLEKGMGGSETAAVQMASKLSFLGHDVSVYANFREEKTFAKTQYLRYERLASDQENNECDIFISSRRLEGIVVAEKLKPKIKVLWVHDINCGPDLNNLAPRYDIIFCLTEWHVDNLRATYPRVDPEKIVLTRNGIETGLFEYLQGEKFGHPKEPGRFVFVSSPDRGLEKLMSYMPEIIRRVPEANLHVYYGFDNWQKLAEMKGDPFELAKINYYKALIQTTEGVVFHGRVGQIELTRELLKSMVWPYPTDWPETSCISAMEAQAAGCVPVCTRYAALGETVKHGILINPESIHPFPHNLNYREEFIGAICRLLTDEPFRKEYAANGRKWALENLDWKGVAEQWETIFQNALSGRPLIVNKRLTEYVEPTPEENKIKSVLVLMTCKRSGRSFVEGTITQIMREGGELFDKLVLLFDGPVVTPDVAPEILEKWEVHQIDEDNNRGHLVAGWTAVCIGEKLGAEKTVIMEDDILICKNSIARMLRADVPSDVSLISFFDADRVIPGAKHGIWRHGARSFSSSLCMVLPRRVARWISLQNPEDHGSCNAMDQFLARTLAKSPWPVVGTHIPNLVEHIGDVSSVWSNESLRQGRVSNNFPGEHFDAMSLDWK